MEYLTAGQAQLDLFEICSAHNGRSPLLVREDDVAGSCIVSRIPGLPWQQILDGFPLLS